MSRWLSRLSRQSTWVVLGWASCPPFPHAMPGCQSRLTATRGHRGRLSLIATIGSECSGWTAIQTSGSSDSSRGWVSQVAGTRYDFPAT
jgi:hypothetical protein